MQSALSFEIEAICPWSGARAGRIKNSARRIRNAYFYAGWYPGELKRTNF